MITYFIYYTFTSTGMSGDGNVDVQVDGPVTNIESVRNLEKGLRDKFGHDSVVICNFKRLEDS